MDNQLGSEKPFEELCNESIIDLLHRLEEETMILMRCGYEFDELARTSYPDGPGKWTTQIVPRSMVVPNG
jgi:hypothetical protein